MLLLLAIPSIVIIAMTAWSCIDLGRGKISKVVELTATRLFSDEVIYVVAGLFGVISIVPTIPFAGTILLTTVVYVVCQLIFLRALYNSDASPIAA